jgi:DNA-binding IclR family transcriptional regulator
VNVCGKLRQPADFGPVGLGLAALGRPGYINLGHAVGIAGPRSRLLTRGREATVAAAVLEAARGISRDLRAPRWPAV